MNKAAAAEEDLGRARFRGVLLRVLAVQAITLIGLWWLERHYGG